MTLRSFQSCSSILRRKDPVLDDYARRNIKERGGKILQSESEKKDSQVLPKNSTRMSNFIRSLEYRKMLNIYCTSGKASDQWGKSTKTWILNIFMNPPASLSIY